ncbi:MAG TPA: N-6 DNA methylase, partial [Candidatus Sulfotelmatobacter sp.]|nr:N-6 DNA methylase [Candidatus Sulfotelmatobacter sp.]
MKVRDNPPFPPPDSQLQVGEAAVGGADPHQAAGAWPRQTKSLGQVATPQAVAELMARWVTSARPRTLLDPAAGLGSLLHECYRLHRPARLVGVERDPETLRTARQTVPPGTRLIGADYLLCETGLFEG